MAALFLNANEVAELSGAPKTVISKAIDHRILSALPADRTAFSSLITPLGSCPEFRV